MNEKATIEQWQELYNISQQIKQLSPWNYLNSKNIITIILPDHTEPVFCSILGVENECFGIASYNGFNGISNYLKIIDDTQIPPSQSRRYLDSTICYFGNREELTKSELQLIKGLDIKFRGKNQWIYFRKFDSDFCYDELPANQVAELIRIFEQLLIVLNDYINKKVLVNFSDNQTILRVISEDSGQWITTRSPLLLPPISYPSITVSKEIIDEIKAKKTTGLELEIDIALINQTIKDKDTNQEYFPKLVLLVNHVSKQIIDKSLTTYTNDNISVAVTIFIDYIKKYGRPKTLFVRDEFLMSIFYDICSQSKIKLKQSSALRGIDKAINDLASK